MSETEGQVDGAPNNPAGFVCHAEWTPHSDPAPNRDDEL